MMLHNHKPSKKEIADNLQRFIQVMSGYKSDINWRMDQPPLKRRKYLTHKIEEHDRRKDY